MLRRRLFSWLLMFCVMASLLPYGALAADEPTWSKEYQKFVLGEGFKTCGQEYGFRSYGVSTIDYNYVEFGLYDLDRNGVPELIAHRGADAASSRQYVYTCKSNTVQYLGSIGAYETEFFCAPYSNYGGLFDYWTNQGFMNCSYITITNGKLQETDVFGINYNTNLTESGKVEYAKGTSDNSLYQVARSSYDDFERAGIDEQYHSKYPYAIPMYSLAEIKSMGWNEFVARFRFVDVPNNAYFDVPVRWASDRGITQGTGVNTFSPDATCTRGQVVTFLWRAKGSPAPKSSRNPFSDVTVNDYYGKAVLWAVENGITQGMGGGQFAPDSAVTRAQVVTFLWRAEGQPSASGANPFGDVASGQYYYSAVLWAVSKNITQGTSASTFSPDNPCTRAQIVTFLYRDMK